MKRLALFGMFGLALGGATGACDADPQEHGCRLGTLGCECLDAAACGEGLVCEDNVCIDESGTSGGGSSAGSGASDGGDGGDDGRPGDDSGSTSGGDGDDSSSGDEPSCFGDLDCPCEPGECDADFVCIDAVCSELPVCDPDPNESNNHEDSAISLGEISDADSEESSITGIISDPDDVDWFKYHGTDGWFDVVNPWREVSAGLRLCSFAQCDIGLEQTEVECPKGTTKTSSPDGRPGCCHSEGTAFELNLNCADWFIDGDDSAMIYLRVDGGAPEDADAACVPYSLGFHF